MTTTRSQHQSKKEASKNNTSIPPTNTMNIEVGPWGYRLSDLETTQKRPMYKDTFSEEELNYKQKEVIEQNNQDPNRVVVEEVDTEEEINEEELFEHSNNPKILKLMGNLLRKDPNSYFFKLALRGAKLLVDFNVEALKDANPIPLGDNSLVRHITEPPEMPNMPPIFSQNNSQIKENPLYRKSTQIEQVVVAQQYQGGPSQYIL